jgi:hypothetical protein
MGIKYPARGASHRRAHYQAGVSLKRLDDNTVEEKKQ